MAELKLSNWGKKSNPRLKFYADLLVYTLPLYLTAIVALPDDVLSGEIKIWVNFGLTILIVTFKMISKLTSDES